MSDLAIPGLAYAEANWGAWIARCPRPYCTNAMGLDRGQRAFACLGPDSCGFEADVIWPADPQAIEAILEMRPVSRTRNWLPGESLEDLLQENAEHGCVPPDWGAVESGEALVICDIADGRVVGGLLHQQLVAAGRREIGA